MRYANNKDKKEKEIEKVAENIGLTKIVWQQCKREGNRVLQRIEQ